MIRKFWYKRATISLCNIATHLCLNKQLRLYDTYVVIWKCMEEMRNADRILVTKPEGKEPIG
jgi:hypothetical protein